MCILIMKSTRLNNLHVLSVTWYPWLATTLVHLQHPTCTCIYKINSRGSQTPPFIQRRSSKCKHVQLTITSNTQKIMHHLHGPPLIVFSMQPRSHCKLHYEDFNCLRKKYWHLKASSWNQRPLSLTHVQYKTTDITNQNKLYVLQCTNFKLFRNWSCASQTLINLSFLWQLILAHKAQNCTASC